MQYHALTIPVAGYYKKTIMKIKIIVTIGLLVTVMQATAQQFNWGKWQALIGEWKGEGDGAPGKGSGTFSFTAALDGHVLVRKGHSEYPAVNSRPAAVHDDLMVIYLDKSNNPSQAIYFDNEGHTLNYSISYTDNAIILLSEKISNTPTFRLTYTFPEANTTSIKFELSMDGNNFKTYVEGKSIKIK